jgi:hypothetical protein
MVRTAIICLEAGEWLVREESYSSSWITDILSHPKQRLRIKGFVSHKQRSFRLAPGLRKLWKHVAEELLGSVSEPIHVADKGDQQAAGRMGVVLCPDSDNGRRNGLRAAAT